MRIDTTPIALQRGDLTLRGLLQIPEDGAGIKPVCILFHGLTVHHAYHPFDTLSEALLAAGNIVLRMDFNGHGISDGLSQDMTISNEIEDAEAILSYAQSLSQGGPIVIIGHSQGGVVSAAMAAKHGDELAAVVLLAPGVNIIEEHRSGQMNIASFDPTNIPDTITLSGKLFGRDYILDCPKHDPYVDIAAYHGPLLIVQGDEDAGITLDMIRRFQKCSNGGELQIMEGSMHGFEEHEVELAHRVVEWVGDILA